MKLLAPNGKPSNLTPKQYRLVRTPAFKKWFGDWENSPETASKIVDENGEPLVVYRGEKKKTINIKKHTGRGLFFTDDYDVALLFTDDNWNTKPKPRNVKAYFLNIKKPFILAPIDEYSDDFRNISRRISKKNQNDIIKGRKFYEQVIQDSNGRIVSKKLEKNKSKEIDLDEFNEWVFNKKEYNGVIAKNIDEADDEQITTNDYIAFKPEQIKLADGTNKKFDGSNPDIRFDLGGTTMRKPKTKLLAPNGKPSNLTPEQYRLVRTPEFKKWFGDWENSPETASKVIDENGEPLVVYHTTDKEYTVFNNRFSFFSKDLLPFGSKIIKAFLSINNPYILNDADSWSNINISKIDDRWEEIYNDLNNEDGIVIENVCNWAKERGYDGVIAKNIGETEDASITTDDYVSFNPTQIKLADGSNTTFDGSNPDIRFYDGGEIKITNDKLHDRTEDTYSIGKSYADVTKGNNSWSINYIESRSNGDGSKLINKIIDDAKKQNVSHINLQTGNGSETFFMKFGFQVTEEDNGYFYMKWSNPDIRFYDGGSLLDKMYRGKIYNGDKIKKIVSTYVNVEGNDMVQFAKENIKNKDRYILDYVSIDKLLERDSSLKSFVDDEQQYNHSPTEKEATSPILLGDGWDNEINVVVDGYHRVLEAVNNKQEKILAFIKVYENDYLNSGNYLRFDNGGGIKSPIYTAIFINKDDLINKYQPIHKNIFYHHSTIEFRPQDISNFPTGKEVKLNIIGRLTTDKVDVLLVDSPLSKKKHPHITLSTAEGINPMQGDIEIAENLNKIIKMNDSVNGVYDIFYGEDIKPDKMLDGGQTDFKYYLVVKNDKPVFRTKFTGHSDKTEKDMVDMLDKLIDLHYELKPITENEYKEFKYNDVDKKDLAEFTENWTYFRNGGQIKQDNKIVFKRNRLPRKDIYEFAKMVKEKYPKVWAKGGNIFGNEAFVRLERVFKRGYWLPSEEWMQIKWQSYIARHHKDFRIEGVVAMLKWIATTDKGWRYMKNLLNEEIEKQYPTVDDNYKNGGQLDGKCSVGTKVQSLIFSKDDYSKQNAKDWAEAHGYKYGDVDEKENTYRLRQADPKDFVKGIFRTIEFKKGIKAIVACPKN